MAAARCARRVSTIGAIARCLQTTFPPATPCSISTTRSCRALVGGHSLGGQLACCYAALHPVQFAELWLVASGSPYWRNFPVPMRYGLPLAFRLLPWLARRQGVLHGRKLGFGGTEARSLIADWAQVGRSNRYRAAGAPWDLERALGQLRVPIRAVTLARDTLGPAGALRALLDKMPQAHPRHVRLTMGNSAHAAIISRG